MFLRGLSAPYGFSFAQADQQRVHNEKDPDGNFGNN
jgi:hypothetical protein